MQFSVLSISFLLLGSSALIQPKKNSEWIGGDLPIHTAARQCDIPTLKRLIALKANLNVLNFDHVSALFLAASMHNEEGVRLLLEAGASPSPLGVGNPLQASITSNCEECVDSLIKHHAHVNLKHVVTGETALMNAAKLCRVGIMKSLLEAKADPDSESTSGERALKMAAQSGCVEGLRLLVEHKAFLDSEGSNNALRASIRSSCQECADLLIKAGASVEDRDRPGFTLLMESARLCRVGIMNSLLAAGAQVNLATFRFKTTALMLAAKAPCRDGVRVLLENGADHSLLDSSNRNALYHAVSVVRCNGKIGDVSDMCIAFMATAGELVNAGASLEGEMRDRALRNNDVFARIIGVPPLRKN